MTSPTTKKFSRDVRDLAVRMVLERHLRMMDALEAAGGMLLFGIGTAYIFALMQMQRPMLARDHGRWDSTTNRRRQSR
jgi:hypothetical protein